MSSYKATQETTMPGSVFERNGGEMHSRVTSKDIL